MKTEEYLKLYANELINASKITDENFERKRDLLDLFYLALINTFKKEEMRTNRLGIENVIVLEDEKTITYVVALIRPGLLIGVNGETINSVIKKTGERILWTNNINHIKQKEIKIDLVETLSRWSAVKRMGELVDFYCNFSG